MQRGLPGFSALAFVCVLNTGRCETSHASRVVVSPPWETSTGHANFVHALDHLYAKMTQATVVALKSTRAETVPVVVDQLTNALAKKIEPIDIVDTAGGDRNSGFQL